MSPKLVFFLFVIFVCPSDLYRLNECNCCYHMCLYNDHYIYTNVVAIFVAVYHDYFGAVHIGLFSVYKIRYGKRKYNMLLV